IRVVPCEAMRYDARNDEYVVADAEAGGGSPDDLPHHAGLRSYLKLGREIPGWFTFPEVARELQRRYPPRRHQGLTVLLTGLSGAGKSTIAKALTARL